MVFLAICGLESSVTVSTDNFETNPKGKSEVTWQTRETPRIVKMHLVVSFRDKQNKFPQKIQMYTFHQSLSQRFFSFVVFNTKQCWRLETCIRSSLTLNCQLNSVWSIFWYYNSFSSKNGRNFLFIDHSTPFFPWQFFDNEIQGHLGCIFVLTRSRWKMCTLSWWLFSIIYIHFFTKIASCISFINVSVERFFVLSRL